MKKSECLDSLVSEYRSLLSGSLSKDNQNGYNEKNIIKHLTKSADWTTHGASEILGLANNYGAFVLRNALALAVALGKEDGDLGL